MNRESEADEVSEMSRIAEKIIEQIEKKRKEVETYNNWKIAIYTTEELEKKGENAKRELKLLLQRKYPLMPQEEHCTTANVFLRKNDKVEVEVVNDTIYIAGRYRKNVRGISNTPITFLRDNRNIKQNENKGTKDIKDTTTNISIENTSEKECEPVKITTKAVSDWINPIQEYFKGEKCIFMSSGREDIDVRMLGKGRPFIARIENPTKNLPRKMETLSLVMGDTENPKEREERIAEYGNIQIPYAMDQSVELLDLCLVMGKKACMAMKNIQEQKKKRYMAIIYTVEDTKCVYKNLLDAGYIEKSEYLICPQINLAQKTPLRSLHRRADLTRERNVYDCRIEILTRAETDEYPPEGTLMRIDLVADAGTYIKEFVNGDMGRTTPSLSQSINRYCDVVELDVTGIDSEFPLPEHILCGITLIKKNLVDIEEKVNE